MKLMYVGMHGSIHVYIYIYIYIKRSATEMLDQAITHVRQLGERVEMLKQKKQLLQGTSSTNQDRTRGIGDHMMDGSCSTVLTVRDVGSMLEVCVKSVSNNTFTLNQVIQVLVEEAAQVVAVSYSSVGGMIFYTIIVQVHIK